MEWVQICAEVKEETRVNGEHCNDTRGPGQDQMEEAKEGKGYFDAAEQT